MPESSSSKHSGRIRDSVRHVESCLEDPATRRLLAETLVFYYSDIRETVTFTEILSEGQRPDGLTNEVYACFHHIARGLVEAGADPDKELRSAAKWGKGAVLVAAVAVIISVIGLFVGKG